MHSVGTKFNLNLQTYEDEAKSFTHEVQVTLDEVNSCVQIGQGDVAGVWEEAAFTDDEIILDKERPGKVFDVNTSGWKFIRNQKPYRWISNMKNTKSQIYIMVIGECKQQ